MLELVDDRGRHYKLPRAPERIVSLVPSDTYTLIRLGLGDRLVGRTKYCVEPADVVDRIETFGGTKDADLDRIVALRPELVIANREENTERIVDRLEAERIPVFVTFPKRVNEGISLIARFAKLFGAPRAPEAAREIVRQAYKTKQRIEDRARAERPKTKVFVPIWNEPLMTIHGDTFISDLLAQAGGENVFADRRRAYPLAADVAGATPHDAEKVGDRDTRYPRVTMAEVEERAPEVILLPSEPHAFTEADKARFLASATPAAKSGRVHLCDGRDLMWPGLRSLEGLERIEALLSVDAIA